MNYIEQSLSRDETIEHRFPLHWTAKIWLALWIVLAIPSFGVTLLLAAYEWLRLRSIEMGVTNKRVIYKTGIISRKSEEMRLGSIETVEIDQSVLGRILGYGTVRVTGRGVSDLVFKNIDEPIEVKRKIESVAPYRPAP